MLKRTVVLIALPVLMLSPLVSLTRAQTDPSSSQSGATRDQKGSIALHVDGWYRPVPEPSNDQKAGPAPVHDLSGIWEPAAQWHAHHFDVRIGNGADGAINYPNGPNNFYPDGPTKRPLPFTPLGEQAFKANKSGQGDDRVPEAFVNDPFEMCDPLGFPRDDLFNLRAVQIVQTKKQVLILHQNERVWRNIWADGRELPQKFPEPRWYGYSVGKWVDDTTFVAQTAGLDERTWLDNVGRPHSSDLVVEERFHRVNADILELTVTINDPKMYTKPWVSDKLTYKLQPQDALEEGFCVASEEESFTRRLRNPAAGKQSP